MIESLVPVVKQHVEHKIDYSTEPLDEELRGYIQHFVLNDQACKPLTLHEKHRLIHRVFAAFRGLDVIQQLIDDVNVSEIMVNQYDEIYVEEAGRLKRTNLQFESESKLEDIIQWIVSKVNRTVNESSPIVDARLEDGSRVNVVLPPIALKGPALTIRKFPEEVLTIDHLIKAGSISEEAATFLQRLVKAKYNILVSGGTGAGKTTLLNVLAQQIPEEERIITIEDSAELQLPKNRNVIRLETRNANTEGKGEITIRQLIRTSLRMRPNRIIVGEVRGGEAIEMLQAMNTGHEGSFTTGHANNAMDMLLRLEMMARSGADVPMEVIRQQINAGIDVIVHLERMPDHTRKITQIFELRERSSHEEKSELNCLFHLKRVDQVDQLVRTTSKMTRVNKLLKTYPKESLVL